MSPNHELLQTSPALLDAQLIVDGLPPTGPEHYLTNRQPHYEDTDALIGAVATIIEDRGIATLGDIDSLQEQLTEVQTGNGGPVVTDGRCAVPVYHTDATDAQKAAHVAQLTDEREAAQGIIRLILPGAVIIPRAELQCGKPRSEAADAQGQAPYMGDMINGAGSDERAPDPERMVTALEQAKALNTEARRRGMPGWVAHEGLLLLLEEGLVRTDEATGRVYSVASHMIWAGERTRDPEGPHIAMLSRIANPVGVKIGPTATAEDIAALHEKLNPHDVPGKLTFMVRMGLQHGEQLDAVAGAIANRAPSALVEFDIHGTTVPVEKDGTVHKVRSIPNIVGGIIMLAETLDKHGLKLHGLNLETTGEDGQYQCVDTNEPGDLPRHPGGVDPQLNLMQFARVLSETHNYLVR